MKLTNLNSLMAAAGLICLGLTGCGGSSSDDTPPAAAPAQTTPVSITVVDGAIQGAVVCLDKNTNGACDTGEVMGTTDADGKVTLAVPTADAGLYPIVAVVGVDAVDKDNGPVTVPFVLKAPADQAAVVSPLTTLVQAMVETGVSSAQAEQSVKDQLGITVSLFSDFTQDGGAANIQAGTLARLIVVTKQGHVTATAGATSSTGTALTPAQLDAAMNASLLNSLPAIAQAAADPAVAAATTAIAREAAVQAAATQIATDAGLTASTVATIVAANQQPVATEVPNATPAEGASLRWFSYVDLTNFMYRAFHSTALENTIDAEGKRHFTEYRERRTPDGMGGATILEWGDGLNNWVRGQIYWTGSEWFDCPTAYVHEVSPANAAGESEAVYCRSFKSKSRRADRDIGGAKLIDIVKEIRAYPLFDTAGKFASWGPDPTNSAIIAMLGETTFPVGSKLSYYTTTPTSNPDTYGTSVNDVALVFPADISSGIAEACAPLTSSNSASYQTEASTLELLVARNPGLPCVFTANDNTGPTNEAWGTTSVGIGDVTVPTMDVLPFYKNGVKRIRAAFGANNTVTYLSCLARASDNSPRNCTAIGTGSYAVETLGSNRVLRLAGVPGAAAGLGYNRIFVEHDGKVSYGSRDKLQVTNQLRLNLAAADSLLTALDID